MASGAQGSSATLQYLGNGRWTAVRPDSSVGLWSASGNDAFRTNGNVGIGKSDPASALDVNGTITASNFLGDGLGLTGLSAAHVTGTLGTAQIPALDASTITTGSIDAARIPNLDASKITSGTLDTNRIPNLDASNLTTGMLDNARLSTNVALLGRSPQAFTGLNTFAGQVGIGTTTPSSALDVRSGSTSQVSSFEQTGEVGAGLNVVMSNGNNSAPAISVSHLGHGIGLLAQVNGGTGVKGVTDSITSAGVVGQNTAGGEAVVGLAGHSSDPNWNGAGVGAVVGRNDLMNGYGVRGFVTKSNAIGVLGQAGRFGSVNIAGRFENNNSANTNDVLQVNNTAGATGNLLTLTAGTGAVATFRSSGNVGLGTTLPKQRLHNIGDYYGRGHVWLHAQGGDGTDGIAYVQARDDSGSSSIAMRLRSQLNGSVVEAVHIGTNGNVGIGTVNPTNKLDVAGNASATTFITTSDRNAKENFNPISPADVLAKVAALPIQQWNFKTDTRTTHIGPMAQDFYAAFGVGPDDRHIATVDADGVALAAIQGLNQKLEATRAENAELRKELQQIKQLLSNLTSSADFSRRAL